MRLAINRYSALIFGWIPDVSEIPTRRLVLIGVAVSAGLHLLAFLLLVLFSGIFNKPDVAAEPKREIELVVVPPDEAPLEPVLPLAPEPQRHFLDMTGLDISKVAPPKADFESSENGIAASEQPGKGDIPLPNQEGRDLPFAAFKSQRALFGSTPTPFPADPSTTSLSPPPPDANAPSPEDVAMKPPPEPPPQPEKSEKKSAPATPAPAATPPPKSLEKTETPDVAQATPPPMKVEDKTKEDQIAVSTKPAATPPPSTALTEQPQPKPVPTPIAQAPAPPRPIMRQAMLTTPAPRAQPPAQSSTQLEQVQTHIEGNISNRGRRSANTVSTPFGKYEKQVHDAIASRWQYYVKDHADVVALGSAEVIFVVDSSGHVRAVRVESNTSNQSFADVCERAIREAELPEPPPDVITMMRDGHLEFPMKFTLYPFQ